MRIYAQFGADGFPKGFWTEDVWPPHDGNRHPGIPNDVIEISEDQWNEFLDNQGLRQWENGQVIVYTPPPPPEIFPVISDRQFFQALALTGQITQEEALAAVKTGEIPLAMRPFVEAIQDPQHQFAARMLLSGATQFDRHNQLVNEFGQALGWSDEDINQLWRTAATL